MASHLGDLFRCPDARCGFEVLVVHGTGLPSHDSCRPTCCCGLPMTVVKT